MPKVKFKPTTAMQSMVADSGANGSEFELLCKFVQEGPDWCLKEVEGNKMPGYEDNPNSKPASDMAGGKVGATYKAAMAAPPTGGGTGGY